MMDSIRRTVDNSEDAIPDAVGDAAPDTPGIEPPPVVGLDERRMHVRAYNFWAKLLDGRSFPSIESLNLDELGDFGANTVLLDFTSGIENPAIGFVGEAIAAECQLDDAVQFIADVPRRSLLSRLTDHYLQIIANRAPIGFEAEFVNERDITIMYRGVLLPFSSDDDTIDFILGVINWKQAAETELSDALSEELAAAALATPHARPTAPVWADGPEAVFESIDSDSSFEEPSDYGDELVLDGLLVATTLDPAEATLADWLANAREYADAAAQASVRGHNALYQAVGQAWGFACAARTAPADYAELLDEAGIVLSDRSPMTAIVKLVFGAGYDKTRLAEYAAVLGHAAENAIETDALASYLMAQPDGIKGLVKKIRSAKNATRPANDPMDGVAEKLRHAVPLARVELPYVESEQEFSVLVARRMPDGGHAIVAMIGDDDSQRVRTLKAAARRL
ncbi:MAG: hypothetical protein ABL874_01365 [Sphingopyxis sp.]